jgi:hypothetical protein
MAASSTSKAGGVREAQRNQGGDWGPDQIYLEPDVALQSRQFAAAAST